MFLKGFYGYFKVGCESQNEAFCKKTIKHTTCLEAHISKSWVIWKTVSFKIKKSAKKQVICYFIAAF